MTNKSIILIEDDLDLQFLFKECLRELGIEVFAFINGLGAIDYLRGAASPEMIIMDLTFPSGTPEEFISQLKEIDGCENIPLVLISGKSDIQEYAVKFKSVAFLRKPFDVDLMIDTIKNIL